MDGKRNPVIIPKKEPTGRCCPKCKGQNYGGRNFSGMVLFTCRDCGQEFGGGLPQVPEDPSRPRPHYEPQVTYEKNPKPLGPDDNVRELRKPVPSTPAFKRGLPVPQDGEEDV